MADRKTRGNRLSPKGMADWSRLDDPHANPDHGRAWLATGAPLRYRRKTVYESGPRGYYRPYRLTVGRRKGTNYETQEAITILSPAAPERHRLRKLTKKRTALTWQTILIRAAIKLDGPCERKRPFNNSHLSKRRFRSECDRRSYEKVTNQFHGAQNFDQQRRSSCVRSMFTTKRKPRDITREIEINLSGPIRW